MNKYEMNSLKNSKVLKNNNIANGVNPNHSLNKIINNYKFKEQTPSNSGKMEDNYFNKTKSNPNGINFKISNNNMNNNANWYQQERYQPGTTKIEEESKTKIRSISKNPGSNYNSNNSNHIRTASHNILVNSSDMLMKHKLENKLYSPIIGKEGSFNYKNNIPNNNGSLSNLPAVSNFSKSPTKMVQLPNVYKDENKEMRNTKSELMKKANKQNLFQENNLLEQLMTNEKDDMLSKIKVTF